MKRILRVVMLICLITIPSLVQAAVSVTLSTPANRTSCSPITATFTATVTAGCVGTPTYTWYYINNPASSSADTVTFTTTGNTNVRTFSTIGSYNVGVKVVCGTDSGFTVLNNYINYTTQPVIDFAVANPADALPRCVGVVNFNNLSTGDTLCPSHTWRWTVAGGPVVPADQYTTNASFNFTTPGDYTVTLLFLSSGCGGCNGIVTRTSYIHIVGTPTACITRTDNSSGCLAPVATSFSAGCSSGATIYQWSAVGGTPGTHTSSGPNDTTFSPTFNAPGDYPVYVVASNSAGCSATSSTIMVHVGNFTANFPPIAATVCQNATITFTDNTTVDVVSPVMQSFIVTSVATSLTVGFGTGSPHTELIDPSIYAPGVYTVQDYLVNGNGCISSATRNFTVLGAPVTNVTSSNTYRCTPSLVTTYTASPIVGANTYKWITPGATVTLFSATGAGGGGSHAFTYASTGVFGTTLVVTDANGCKDSTLHAALVRIAAPNVTISSSADSGCTPIHVDYHITIDVAGATINVDSLTFGDGSSIGAGIYTDTGHSYTTGGPKVAKVYWHLDPSLGGCSGVDSVITLIGANKPKISVGSFPLDANMNKMAFADSICPGTTVFFKDSTCPTCTSYPGTNWNWSVSNGLGSYTSNVDTFQVNFPRPSVPPATGTLYTYTLLKCFSGCCDTFQHRIFVFPPAIPDNSLTANNAYIAAGGANCTTRDSMRFTLASGPVLGATSYHWYFGPGPGDTANTTTHTVFHRFPALTTYTVTVWAINPGTVADTGVCRAPQSLVINLGRTDTTWSIVDSNICAGGTVIVAGPHFADTTAFSTYFWSWGDSPVLTSINNDSNATHTYTAPGNYTIRVITVNRYGCKDTAQVKRAHVFGGSGPFTATPNPICVGGLVTFTDGNVFPNSALLKRMVSYAYTPSATTLTSIPITPNTFTRSFPEGSWLVVLSDTDNSPRRCPTFDSIRIESVQPHAYFTSPDTTGACANVAISFHDTNTHCTYSWNFGDGTITAPSAADSNITHTYTANGLYTVSVTIVSDGTGGYPLGCSNTFTRNNYINLSNVSGIGIENFGDTSVGCPPLQLAMGPTSTSTSYLYTYTWSVTGTPPITSTSTYLFDQIYGTGTHTVTMIATSPRGCRDTMSRTVFVGGPTGFITVTPTSGCAPVSVHLQFTNTGSVATGTRYVWTVCPFGTFNTLAADTTMDFTVPGDYCPPSVVIENTGCAVDILSTDSIHIYSSPTVSVTHAPRICYGGTDVLTATGADSYSWSSPTAVICTNCSFIAVSPLTTTVYTVIGTNVSGCTDTELVTVVVDPPIIITISGRDSMCIGEQDTLTASGGSGVFTWTSHPGSADSSGISCNVCNPVIIRTTVTRTYWAITTNALGCKDSASFTVTVMPLPILHVTPDPAYVCAGDSTQLFATGAFEYLWKPRIGLSNDSISNPKSGITANIIYSLTGTTQFGCRDSITVPVESYHRNVVGIRSDTVICAGDQARLFAFGGQSYRWRPGNTVSDSTIYNPIATPTVTTVYTVYVKENPCFDTTLNVRVTVIPIPILRVPPTITIIAGNSVQLYADSLNAVVLTSYAWTPADSTLTCTDCPHPIATPIVTTTYSVAASTIEGCTGYASVTIKLLCETSQVFIPNTFTPNGDGVNDRFYVSGKGLGLIKRMAVYNRWGELVYEAYNVRPNDPGVGWDGTYRGEIVAPDVFIYVLDVMCSTGEPFVFRGDISLVR